MKRCTRCNRTYTDDDLNFCLDDGELLSHYSGEEPTRSLRDDAPPPTMVLDPPRNTNPISWAPGSSHQQAQPPMQQTWQPPPMTQPQNYAFAPHPMMMRSSPTSTLAIVSIACGAAAMTIGWCCSTGMLFSPAAIVLGFVSLSQIKRDPTVNGGKGLAIAGICLGAAYILLWLIVMVIWGLANLLPAFMNR